MSSKTGSKVTNNYMKSRTKERARNSIQALCERIEAQNKADTLKRQLLKEQQEDTTNE